MRFKLNNNKNKNNQFDNLDKLTRNDLYREKFQIKDAADHFIEEQENREQVADERKARVDIDAILKRAELKRAAILLKKCKLDDIH